MYTIVCRLFTPKAIKRPVIILVSTLTNENKSLFPCDVQWKWCLKFDSLWLAIRCLLFSKLFWKWSNWCCWTHRCHCNLLVDFCHLWRAIIIWHYGYCDWVILKLLLVFISLPDNWHDKVRHVTGHRSYQYTTSQTYLTHILPKHSWATSLFIKPLLKSKTIGSGSRLGHHHGTVSSG